MKRTSGQKGITLVALIITIIVLLILAVVTIRAVKGDGIINYAKNARSAYELAQENEQAMLDSYISQLEAQLGTGGTTEGEDGTGDEQEPEPTVITWTQTKGRVTNGAGRTIEVGDYINYASKVSGYTDTNGWRVLGAEDGKILLVSAKSVAADFIELDPSNDSATQTKIQNICGKYDAGTHVVANSARTLKAEDIHRITGYTYNGSSSDSHWLLSVTRVNPDENDGIRLRWTITKDGAIINEGKSYNDEATFYKYGLTELALGETFTEESVGLSGSYELKDYLGDSPQALDMFTDMSGDSWETASQCLVNDWWFDFNHEDGGDEWSNSLEGFCGYNSIYGGYLGYDYPQWNMHYGGCVGPESVKLYAVVTLNQDITLTPAGDHAWTLPTE